MKDIIVQFLQDSQIDPVYFITGILDIAAYILWGKLKGGLTNAQRALYKAVIVVAILLTAASLTKYFGYIKDWNELLSRFKP